MRGRLTAYDGPCFLLTEPSGDVAPGGELGLYYEDTRFLSLQTLRIGGAPPVLLSASAGPTSVLVHWLTSAALPGLPYDALLVRRSQAVSHGMHVDIDVTNFACERVEVELALAFDADFADVFEVKRGAESSEALVRVCADAAPLGKSVLGLGPPDAGWKRRTEIRFSKRPRLDGATARFDLSLARGETFHLCQDVYTIAAGDFRPPRNGCAGVLADLGVEGAARAAPATPGPTLVSDFLPLDQGFARALDDLRALRIRRVEGSDDSFHLAAGAPWFMALFGRDSLLAATQAIAFVPDLAKGVLRSLARLQGRVRDPENEEEPGKILHEHRAPGLAGARRLIPKFPYYGAVDTTPLFVRLVWEEWRRNGDARFLREMEPHVDAALAWALGKMDARPDELVDYQRSTDHGLVNQGWKDSVDSVRFRDGGFGAPPIALVEVQGYVAAALRAGAALTRALGRAERAARALEERADGLVDAIDRAFWLEDRGFYALAIDGAGRQVDALASNGAHLLWSGAARPERVEAAARALVGGELASGFGLRTMGRAEAAYNPISYHCGSVWPHDTSLAIAGLARAGRRDEAARLAGELLRALASYPERRLPELYAGLGDDATPHPVDYPTANSPQAWAAGAVLLVTAVLLGLDVDVPARRITLAPALPPQVGRVRVDDLEVAGARVQIEVRREGGRAAAEVRGAPPGWTVETGGG